MLSYTFYSGKDSAGNNIGPQRTGLTAQQLGKLCNDTAGCAGFTSSGWLKSLVKVQLDPFPNWATVCEGIFIRKSELAGRGGQRAPAAGAERSRLLRHG